MKALVGTFNQEKALEGAFSVIVKPIVEPMEHYTALLEMETAIWCRDHLFSPSAAVKPSPSLQAGLGALGSAALMATSNSSIQSSTWPEGS